jgi:hypothetical protein
MASLNILDGDLIGWGTVQPYVTKRGKVKLVVRGEPSEPFWQAWKGLDAAEKIILKNGGFRIGVGWRKEPAKTKTGKTKVAPDRNRKVWFCELWVNNRNRAELEAAGFEMPDVPENVGAGVVEDAADADAAELCGAEVVPF